MIVAVLAEKGGVGKTVIATNLAGMRAQEGRSVLLVNADRQGSADLWARYREGRRSSQGCVCVPVWASPREVP